MEMASRRDLIIPLEVFTDDLRKKEYRGHPNPLYGHCYVACEVFFHLFHGRFIPCFIRHEGLPHWFLRERSDGTVLDPTVSQFEKVPDYSLGVGKGFLTKKPSKRAQIVLNRLEWRWQIPFGVLGSGGLNSCQISWI
jgi:hypothetical protein